MFARLAMCLAVMVGGLVWAGLVPLSLAKPGSLTEHERQLGMPSSRYRAADAHPRYAYPEAVLIESGKRRVYRFFVPPMLTADAPTLLLLHGAGRDGRLLLDRWRDIAAREGLLLVAPQSPKHGWATEDARGETLAAMIAAARRRARLADGPTLLFGHSAGAVVATRLAISDPERFVAVVAHAGYAGERAVRKSAMLAAGSPAPIHILLGEADENFPFAIAQASARAMVGAGAEVELLRLAGHTHWYYSAAPEINRIAWSRFRKHLQAEGTDSYSSPGSLL